MTVGIDIGSSALKAVAVDPSGDVVASFRRRHRLALPSADRMEHEAGKAWRSAPRSALAWLSREVERIRGSGATVRGVCVAGLVPSLAAVDDRGVPCSPGLLYGDARGAVATASPASPRPVKSSSAPVGHAPDLLRFCASVAPGAAGYWPAQAVANCALTGRGVVDISTAMSMAPLYDGYEWSSGQVRASGADPAQLPAVVTLGAAVGAWRDAAVASGIVDTLAEQLVAGATDDGDVLVICGTTLVIWIVTSAWREVPGLWTVPHTEPGKVLVGGASNAGGLFLDWARRLTGPGPAASPPGAHVPVWAPYPRGERTPLHDPDRRAMLVDLQLSDDAAGVRRAAYEATGFVVRQHIDLAGIPARRLVVTGGGGHDAEWMSALADTTGLPAEVVAVPEGAALGAAFVARIAAGLERSVSDAGRWVRGGRRFEPDAVAVEAAERRYQLFRGVSAQ